MKRMKVLALLLSVSCVVGMAEGAMPRAQVVATRHPTWEVVVADDVMAPPQTGIDAAPEIQRRMAALARVDGGTLFLKAGTYTIASPLVLPPNVTLKGDYDPNDARASTCLAIVCGRGNENGTPALQLNAASGLQGLYFYYPEQSLADPKPYPWTVVNALKPVTIAEHQTVRDCTFVNSWQALAAGPHWSELHTFRDVRICALKKGVFIDTISDTGRTEDVAVSPRFWYACNLQGVPSESDLRAYLRSHDTVGVEIGRSDWENIWRLSVDGYRVGCRFKKGLRGLSNAVMAECSFARCGTGLEVGALNGVGVGVYDAAFTACDCSVRGTTNFQTVVQLLDCAFGGKQPINNGGRFATFLIGTSGVARIRHKPMAWPRPKSSALFLAADYGVATNNSDNAAALERAFDAARQANGGTVYLTGGRYALRRGIVVPSGVELRGNVATPHHTISEGTMLLAYAGKGDENGTPLIQLEKGAGVRGLSVWYPENPVCNPLPYPWAIRSLGPDCWVADVNIANAWQAVDFATFPSCGHRIAYLSGNAWRRGLFVGNSAGSGWVENTQFNPHYAHRLPKGLPVVRGEPPPEIPNRRGVGQSPESHWMRKRFEAHVFRDCADEHILSLLVYAARDGVTFAGKNKATLVIHGADTSARAMEIAQAEGSELHAALCQLVPYETLSGKESAGVHFAPEDAGTSFFNLCQFWVNKPTIIGEGNGTAHFAMANSRSGDAELRRGTFTFSDFRFSQTLGDGFCLSPAAKVTRIRSGYFDYPNLTLPALPPKDLVVDFDKVVPSENVVGRYGCIREANWCSHVFGKTYRFRAALKKKPHSNVYGEVLKDLAIPVYPETVLSYRIRPRSPATQDARDIAFDLHFTDGTIMRDAPYPAWPQGNLKPNQWNAIRLRLTGSIGKTIDYIMLRVDKRTNQAECYEADFDSIAIKTARADSLR